MDHEDSINGKTKPVFPESWLGKFGLILADPPWRYSNVRRGKSSDGAARYDTMTDVQLYNLPVGKLAADDALLVLWTTWAKAEVARDLIARWEFTYVTGLPWVKVQGISNHVVRDDEIRRPANGTGYWLRGCSEQVLIARRGRPAPPEGPFHRVGILSERFEHSRKPDNAYDLCEVLSSGPYLELFARRERAGWTSWGNELKLSPCQRAANESGGDADALGLCVQTGLSPAECQCFAHADEETLQVREGLRGFDE